MKFNVALRGLLAPHNSTSSAHNSQSILTAINLKTIKYA
jgi:hypothetical protein